MLPFGAQAANQAFEDAGAIGVLFKGVDHQAQVAQRLCIYEKVRRNRASLIQILSLTRIGRENMVQEELYRYAEPGVKSEAQKTIALVNLLTCL